ncbi:MAG TPA: glutathione S-transferase family protein [Bauldia sp.]|nr:glutathione S-transferase family protein [Bauldia sp.]
MKLYNAGGSPNALRTRAVLYELGIEFERIDIDFRNGANRTPEYLKLNPNAKVPVLVDGDVVIWESRAINAYLAAKYPAKNLYPADLPTRAVIDQWSYWQAIHLGPAMQRVAFERVHKKAFGRGEPDEAVIAAEMKNVDQFLDVFEVGLSDGREWIAGSLSVADFALATTFVHRVAANLPVPSRPKVTAWIERMEKRPSWEHAVADIAPKPKATAAA